MMAQSTYTFTHTYSDNKVSKAQINMHAHTGAHTHEIHTHTCVHVSEVKTGERVIVQELCESRGGRPELSVLMRLLVSVETSGFRGCKELLNRASALVTTWP